MMMSLLLSAAPVTAFALLVARREYRQKGKLTILGLGAICAMLFLPNLMLHYNCSYELPSTFLDLLGTVIAAGGIILVLPSILSFRSAPKMLCLDPGELTLEGPYRWSRNPQYMGWFLFLGGFALNDPSLWALAALAVIGISLHLLVLVEEEHLLRVFGDGYKAFQRQVPRYLGWGKRGTGNK